jgi:hypothetical protein
MMREERSLKLKFESWAFWAEMGVAYLKINKLPCLHELDIPKCINVYKTILGFADIGSMEKFF